MPIARVMKEPVKGPQALLALLAAAVAAIGLPKMSMCITHTFIFRT